MKRKSKIFEAVKEKAQRRRAALAEKGIWLTARREEVPIIKMDIEHLANILRCYKDQRPPFDLENEGLRERLAAPLFREAVRRGLVGDISRDRFDLIELK